MSTAIKIENVSKLYRLGTVGTGTISHDLNRWWHQIRGKEDPYAKVGQVNDRTKSSTKNEEPGTTNGAAPDYVWALRDINLEVQQGEILGIIGRNGAGKSTLLKLLSRVTAPTTGSIKTKGRIASLLEVGTGFHPELTGRENIYMNGAILGMRRHEITKRLDEIVEFSGCAKYLDTPVKRYSSGMTVRLGFAVAAHLDCEILVVDEVLAVGDAEFQRKCIGKMQDISQGGGRTVLFVSHNMGSINQLCGKSVVMAQGGVQFYGDVREAVAQYLNVSRNSASRFVVSPDSKFAFESVAIVSDANEVVESIRSQEPVRIRIEYIQRERIPGMDVGVRVITRNGTVVFSTTLSGVRAAKLPNGRNTIRVTIPSGFLAPGVFLLDIAAHIPNQAIVDIKRTAVSFKVEETGSDLAQYSGTDFGVVMCNCDWGLDGGAQC